MTDPEPLEAFLDARTTILPKDFVFGSFVRYEDCLKACELARASEREAMIGALNNAMTNGQTVVRDTRWTKSMRRQLDAMEAQINAYKEMRSWLTRTTTLEK